METPTLYVRKLKNSTRLAGFTSLQSAMEGKTGGYILEDEVFQADLKSLGVITTGMVPTKLLKPKAEAENLKKRAYASDACNEESDDEELG